MLPNPSLIPRFNFDYGLIDFCSGTKSIFSNNEFDTKSLESVFGGTSFFFTNYGRTALYVILKSLDISPKSKIGVPLYSCTVVFDAIVNAGFIPVFIDIDENYTIDPNDLSNKIDALNAIIVLHTFGRPADMDKIKKIAGSIPIIEDCAHSLFSEYKGEKTGTMGTASLFSLAKYISVGGGGMIVLNNEALIDDFEKEVYALEKPFIIDEIKHIFIAYMRSFFYHKPWFGLFALPVGLLMENKVDLMDKKNSKVTATYKSDLVIMLKKLATFKLKVELQRNNSFFLIEELKDTSLILPHEKKDTYCNYYLFPVLFENEIQRNKASEYLRGKGIDTSTLFSLTPQISTLLYGYQGDCPYTEQVAEKILTIPNYYTLKEKELNKIVEVLKSCPYVFQ